MSTRPSRGSTAAAHRETTVRAVPLQAIAFQALERIPAGAKTDLLFPSPRGSYFDLHNFRTRDWKPAQLAAGITPLRRVYDLRHTFATFALRAGISTFDLSRYMGASLTMIDRHYGHLGRDGRDPRCFSGWRRGARRSSYREHAAGRGRRASSPEPDAARARRGRDQGSGERGSRASKPPSALRSGARVSSSGRLTCGACLFRTSPSAPGGRRAPFLEREADPAHVCGTKGRFGLQIGSLRVPIELAHPTGQSGTVFAPGPPTNQSRGSPSTSGERPQMESGEPVLGRSAVLSVDIRGRTRLERLARRARGSSRRAGLRAITLLARSASM
jgi:hypothetical protein